MNLDALPWNLGTGLTDILSQLDWAEDEFTAASQRYSNKADQLYHSMSLLTPTHDLMRAEFVFRSHCAELLDRVATGLDTRPGTAAEVACACRDASLAVPFHAQAAGLYVRMWTVAGFPEHPEFDELCVHHEALYGSLIDDLEAFARRKLSARSRRLGQIDCSGHHHGEDVRCDFGPDSLRRADHVA